MRTVLQPVQLPMLVHLLIHLAVLLMLIKWFSTCPIFRHLTHSRLQPRIPQLLMRWSMRSRLRIRTLVILPVTVSSSANWFKEGLAEFLAGADSRVVGRLAESLQVTQIHLVRITIHYLKIRFLI